MAREISFALCCSERREWFAGVAASGSHDFLAPFAIRSDEIFHRGTRLPYAKFPRDPAIPCQDVAN
jgi:hypothetical protein